MKIYVLTQKSSHEGEPGYRPITRAYVHVWETEDCFFGKYPSGVRMPDDFGEFPKSEWSLKVVKADEVNG